MPELSAEEKTRYSEESVNFMDEVTERLYEIWLKLAKERAAKGNRNRVVIDDIKSTLEQAIHLLEEALKTKHG